MEKPPKLKGADFAKELKKHLQDAIHDPVREALVAERKLLLQQLQNELDQYEKGGMQEDILNKCEGVVKLAIEISEENYARTMYVNEIREFAKKYPNMKITPSLLRILEITDRV